MKGFTHTNLWLKESTTMNTTLIASFVGLTAEFGEAATPLRHIDEAARYGARALHRTRRIDDRTDTPRNALWLHCNSRDRSRRRSRRRTEHVVRRRYRRSDGSHRDATHSPRQGLEA